MRIRRYPGRAVDASLSLDQSHVLDTIYQNNWLHAHESIKATATVPPSRANLEQSVDRPQTAAATDSARHSGGNSVSALGKYQMTLEQIRQLDVAPKHATITGDIADLYGYRPSTLRRKNRKNYPGWDALRYAVASDSMADAPCDRTDGEGDRPVGQAMKLKRSQTMAGGGGSSAAPPMEYRKVLPQQQQRLVGTHLSPNGHHQQRAVGKNSSSSNTSSQSSSSSIGSTASNSSGYTKATTANNICDQNTEALDLQVLPHQSAVQLATGTYKPSRDPSRRMRNRADNVVEPDLGKNHTIASATATARGVESSSSAPDRPDTNSPKAARLADGNSDAAPIGTADDSKKASNTAGRLFVIPRPRLIVPVHSYARKRRTGNLRGVDDKEVAVEPNGMVHLDQLLVYSTSRTEYY